MPVTLQPTTLKYKDGNAFVAADCLKGEKGDPGNPGSPGDPTQLIDDTAGSGATTKVWSADKTNSEVGGVKDRVGALEPAASASDIGKALIAKTVSGGKVTSYEFGTAGGGGTSDYSDLTNKPQINGTTLSGNKTAANLGIHEVPSGGTTGQVLAKSSGTDYAVEWATPEAPSADEIVVVSDTTPSDPNAMIWFPETQPTGIQVPTYAEHTALLTEINSMNTATASDVGKALSPKTVTDGKVQEWKFVSVGGGGGSSDYTDLENKPQINGVTLTGEKSANDIGLAPASTQGFTDKTEAYEKTIRADALPLTAKIVSVKGKAYLNSGSAVVLAPSKIESYDASGNKIDEISITDIVSSVFNGKMAGVNGICDDIDFIKQKANKRCAVKKFSELSWTRVQQGSIYFFRASSSGRKKTGNGFMEEYTESTVGQTSADFPDDAYYFTYNSSYIYVRDDSYSTVETFLEDKGNNIVVAALESPTQTTISIADSVKVAPGGKIRIVNTGNLDVQSEISYAIPYAAPNREQVTGDCLTLRRDMPSYYTAQPENPASYNDDSYIDVKVESIPEGKHFIFFTDSHWNWGNNAKHSADLMQYVRKRKGINNVIFGGDFINSADDYYLARQVLGDFSYTYLSAFGDAMLPVVGNHDVNIANLDSIVHPEDRFLPFSILKKVLFSNLPMQAHTQYEVDGARIDGLDIDSEHKAELAEYLKLTYYYDDPVRQIRYIILNSGNPAYGHISDIFGDDDCRISVDWVYKTLCSTPEDYDVALCMHQLSTAWSATTLATGAGHYYIFPTLAMGLKTKGVKETFLDISANANMRAWYPRDRFAFDFSNCNNVGKVFFVIGHAHCDWLAVVTQSTTYEARLQIDTYDGTLLDQTTVTAFNGCPIPCIYTTTDAFGRYNDSPTGHKTEMTENTITEHAFDVFTLKDGEIRTTRFGAGSDRVVYINA